MSQLSDQPSEEPSNPTFVWDIRTVLGKMQDGVKGSLEWAGEAVKVALVDYKPINRAQTSMMTVNFLCASFPDCDVIVFRDVAAHVEKKGAERLKHTTETEKTAVKEACYVILKNNLLPYPFAAVSVILAFMRRQVMGPGPHLTGFFLSRYGGWVIRRYFGNGLKVHAAICDAVYDIVNAIDKQEHKQGSFRIEDFVLPNMDQLCQVHPATPYADVDRLVEKLLPLLEREDLQDFVFELAGYLKQQGELVKRDALVAVAEGLPSGKCITTEGKHWLCDFLLYTIESDGLNLDLQIIDEMGLPMDLPVDVPKEDIKALAPLVAAKCIAEGALTPEAHVAAVKRYIEEQGVKVCLADAYELAILAKQSVFFTALDSILSYIEEAKAELAVAQKTYGNQQVNQITSVLDEATAALLVVNQKRNELRVKINELDKEEVAITTGAFTKAKQQVEQMTQETLPEAPVVAVLGTITTKINDIKSGSPMASPLPSRTAPMGSPGRVAFEVVPPAPAVVDSADEKPKGASRPSSAKTKCI